MARSYQRGTVRPEGNSWVGFMNVKLIDPGTGKEKWKKKRLGVLGSRSRMSKSQARDQLDAEIAKHAGRGGAPNKDSRVRFGWFVRNRWYPLKEADWKPETARDKKCIIQKDLLDPFESIPLEDFDKFQLQVHLNNLAKTRSKDRVLQIKAYMQAIFAEAVDQEFLAKDPARNVKAPDNLRDTDKTTLSWDQLRAALSKLSLKERLILELDMTNALRPEELFGLRWCCFNYGENGSSLELRETAYRGEIRPWGKTKKSLRTIPIPKKLADDLWLWEQECPNSAPEAFMFAKNNKGEFMDSGNFRRRVLHRLAKELKLPKLTFQVIRRSIATLAQKKGGVKDVQGMLRHSRAATTTDVYMQEIPEGVAAVIEAVNAELRQPPQLLAAG
ncbi:MAG TPA: tyrosine-type recombinase/integrase [Terriglobales bacterium]|nr:tyrosine-type recombinase/integrase [Terriglobales bacterium]